MRHTLWVFFALAALVVSPTLASADEVCEDINELSNAWNEVANLVHQYGDQLDTLSEADSAALLEAVGELGEATGLLVGLLQQGDETEQVLADAIGVHAMLLGEASETNAEVVAAVDGIVDGLDLVTDYCDALAADPGLEE